MSYHGPEVVPCRWCYQPVPVVLARRQCERCQYLYMQIAAQPQLAGRMLTEIIRKEEPQNGR